VCWPTDGVQADDLLESAAAHDPGARSRILDVLSRIDAHAADTRAQHVMQPPRRRRAPPAPYPGAVALLARPPCPAGSLVARRVVPSLVSANQMPMLRFKRQPPFLSRVIRARVARRQALSDRAALAERLAAWAALEDAWDARVAALCARERRERADSDAGDAQKLSWAAACIDMQRRARADLAAMWRRDAAMLQAMARRVHEERLLAQEESGL
jgi:hypothetical protein